MQASKLPTQVYLAVMSLLPATCFVGLQWLATTLQLPALWHMLVPWLGAALTLGGLWRYACYYIDSKLNQPLFEQYSLVTELKDDLKMARARRAAAHHYVDRLNVHLEQARANSIALSQSLDEGLQRQLVFQQIHQRLALIALEHQQTVSGHLLKLGGDADKRSQGNTNAAEFHYLQSAHEVVGFYLTELDILAKNLLSTTASHTPQTLQSKSTTVPAQDSTYDLRACVHDAITLLQPYLAAPSSKTQHEIWPDYAPSCPVKFHGDKALVCRAVFHYLLALLDDFESPARAYWILSITFRQTANAASEIAFQLSVNGVSNSSDRQKKYRSDQQPALLQLLSNCGGHLSDNGFYLPVQPINTVAEHGHDMTAQIHPCNEQQRIGLQSCLRGLDINITQHRTANLCIIGITSASAIKHITDQLDLTTTVILLNSPHVYLKASWHVLPTPLHHQALIDCVHLHSIRQHQANILVVDDDKNARLFLCTLLREYGAKVFEAADGVAALATATSESLDLIFMDIHMPRMNGLEATRQLRASIASPLPIIALTAHVIDSERAAIIDAGMSATLIKPVDLPTLRRTLHEWLRADGGTSERHQLASDLPVFDTHLALKIANQRPQLAIEMLALFMQSLDADQTTLRQAHSENDLKTFSQQVHRLNGAAKFCGVPRIQLLLHDMETQLKAPNMLTTTSEGMPEDQLSAALTNALQQLHIELNSLRDWFRTTAHPLAAQAKTTHQLSSNT
jgi:CheY-like chemotaxis protein